MNFYDFNEIRERGDCLQFASAFFGCTPNREGRCQALWRGGDGYNVAISDHEWYDHTQKEGGGIMELCMIAKNVDIQQAQQILGDWLHLTPKMIKQPLIMTSARYDSLIADGYAETIRYPYYDLAGNMVHFVARFEHPTKSKEFMQGTPKGWGLRDVAPILYRQDRWVHAECVAIVEGEKDADTVNDALGLPSTTNCGGAEKWRPEYADQFAGKKVVIIRDNDEAGEAHALRVCRELKDTALELKVICPSHAPKGDVSDWVNLENGTTEALIEMIREAVAIDPSSLVEVDLLKEAAKEANKYPFRNFRIEKKAIGSEVKNVKVPRRIGDLIKEINTRFCGFPRKVGDSKYLFDHDRETGHIVYIEKASSMISWIGRKSQHTVDWARGEGFVEKSELFEGILAEAPSYEAISYVPDWPKRDDVYYAHDALPEPSEDFKFFNEFVEFFSPATEAYKILMKGFICMPLWYIEGIPRPGFTFDSIDGAGAGKTTMVELIAKLYDGTAIRTNPQQLRNNYEDLTKRLVSTTGRIARVLLCDNVTGRFECPELADMMTAECISGKAPYGRGEESRPNNLTYAITANSATMDNDLSDRCYFIKVKRPSRSSKWKTSVLQYIKRNRYQIIADIIAMLEQGTQLEGQPVTRFPEFEESILRAVCKDRPEFDLAIETLSVARADANVEAEYATRAEEEFQTFMLREMDLRVQPGNENIFILGTLAELWMREIFSFDEIKGNLMQTLRGFAKNNHTDKFSGHIERMCFDSGGKETRRRGILWVGDPSRVNDKPDHVIGLKGKKAIQLI